MIGSLNPPKLTGLSQAAAPLGSVPTAGELPQCHHTYCVSPSAPGWLRQSTASNLRPMARLISVLWSGTAFNVTSIPAVPLQHLLDQDRVLGGRRVGGVRQA